MAVRPHTGRPLVFWEQRGVIVDAKGQMVWYQILPGRADIEGVKVVEVGFQVVQLFLGDGRICREGSIAENVIPDVVGHIWGFDSHGTGPLSLDVLCKKRSEERRV